MLIYKERPNWTEEECKQHRRDKIATAIREKLIAKEKRRKWSRNYYLRNREKVIARARARWHGLNKEERQKASAKWYRDHRERKLEYQRQYRLRKKEEERKMLIYKERPNWSEEECKQHRRDKIAKAQRVWRQRQRSKEYYRMNRVRCLALTKEYQRQNKSFREYQKAYTKKRYATDTEYREKVKALQRDNVKAWYQKNKERKLEYQRQYRARKKSGEREERKRKMLIYKEWPNWSEEECKQHRRDKIAKAQRVWRQRQRAKAYYWNNRERCLARTKAYQRRPEVREITLKYQRTYQIQYRKKRYAEDEVYKEKIKAYQRIKGKERYWQNREKKLEYQRQYRLRKKEEKKNAQFIY